MQCKYIRMIMRPVYFIPAIPVIIYLAASFATIRYRSILCAIICVFFTGLLVSLSITARRRAKKVAGQLFMEGANRTNTGRPFVNDKKDSIDFRDTATDDFLCAIGATDGEKSRG